MQGLDTHRSSHDRTTDTPGPSPEEPSGFREPTLSPGFNSWALEHALGYQDGSYRIQIPVLAESYQFKVASDDWAENCGALSPEAARVLVDGAPLDLDCQSPDPTNLQMIIERGGHYLFAFSLRDPDRGQIQVLNRVPPGSENELA